MADGWPSSDQEGATVVKCAVEDRELPDVTPALLVPDGSSGPWLWRLHLYITLLMRPGIVFLVIVILGMSSASEFVQWPLSLFYGLAVVYALGRISRALHFRRDAVVVPARASEIFRASYYDLVVFRFMLYGGLYIRRTHVRGAVGHRLREGQWVRVVVVPGNPPEVICEPRLTGGEWLAEERDRKRRGFPVQVTGHVEALAALPVSEQRDEADAFVAFEATIVLTGSERYEAAVAVPHDPRRLRRDVRIWWAGAAYLAGCFLAWVFAPPDVSPVACYFVAPLAVVICSEWARWSVGGRIRRKVNMAIGPTGVAIGESGRHRRIGWEELGGLVETPRQLIVYSAALPRQVYPIPKRILGGAEAAVRGHLRRHIRSPQAG